MLEPTGTGNSHRQDKDQVLQDKSMAGTDGRFAPGFKTASYWLDSTNPAPDLPAEPLKKVDCVVVGSGYTGLSSAIEIARGGRSVMVLDSEEVGNGCSTRNGGQISTSIKPSLNDLAQKHGLERARAIRSEGQAALEWIEEFAAREQIKCDFNRCGRFHAAHTPQQFKQLVQQTKELTSEGIEANVVTRDEQHNELGTDAYFGGVVFPRHASVNPAKLHRGFLEIALAAGVHVTPNCSVTDISKNKDSFSIKTQRGAVTARDVVVATNGYTSALTPWLQRRVIPIGSYVIATEQLPTGLVDKLFPTNRIASDTCKVVYYYRSTPDRKRIMFGGRVTASETNPVKSAPKLFEDMCRIFPELLDYQISHAWQGTVAYSFDELAHIGTNNGIHYAMGYCGSGVSMAGYLGMRIGQKVLGKKEGRTAFDGLPFPTRPLYSGKPWFLPAAVAWYRWQDRRQCKKAAAMA
jgi:glycine/D-amino acid oxidase-like deaminating enzyme